MSFFKKATFILFDVLACVTLWQSFAFLILQYLTRKTTILYDLPYLGQPRLDRKRIKGTAVVCGGSVSGLWSARFLSDHFEDVLVIDAEEWLATPEGCSPVYDSAGELIEGSRVHARTRVYQYKTTHAFQPITYAVLKFLYPSVDDEIRGTNGRIGKADFKCQLFDKELMRSTKTADGNCIQNFFLSRESFERLLRRLIIRNTPRVRWMAGTVKGVGAAQDNANALSSVVVRLPDSTEMIIPAQLVIDCTGTSQAGLKWLKRVYIHMDRPPRGRIALDDPRLRISYYTNQQTRTFYFPIPPNAREKLPVSEGYQNARWLYTFTPLLGKGRKSVFVDRVEGHRIRIMVGTWGDLPLPEVEQLKEFFDDFNPLQTIPKWLLDLIDILLEYRDQAEVVTSKYPTLSRIQYDKAACVPSNFVAVGDSVMQVNPTFGQGFSKALVGAIVLDSVLRSKSAINSTTVPSDFSRRFFKEVVLKTAVAWDGTKPLDYLFPSTTPVQGEELSDGYWTGKLFTSLVFLSTKNNNINHTMFRAFNFFGAPSELLHPFILARVLLLWARQRLGLAMDFLRD